MDDSYHLTPEESMRASDDHNEYLTNKFNLTNKPIYPKKILF